MNQMQILTLPESIHSPNQVERMFWGIPFIGVDKRLFARLRKIQASRTHDIDLLWNVRPELLAAKHDMDAILMEYFEWPCPLFHPCDVCEALFFYPFGDLLDVEGYMEIEGRFPGTDNFDWVAYWSRPYIELLERLVEIGMRGAIGETLNPY